MHDGRALLSARFASPESTAVVQFEPQWLHDKLGKSFLVFVPQSARVLDAKSQ
jgi:hypothetical protein